MNNEEEKEKIIKLAFRVFRNEDNKKKNLISNEDKKKLDAQYLRRTEEHLKNFYQLKESIKNTDELEDINDKELRDAIKDSKKIYNYINKILNIYIAELDKSKETTSYIKKKIVEEIYMNGMSKDEFINYYLSEKNERCANDCMRRYINTITKDVAPKIFGIYGY